MNLKLMNNQPTMNSREIAELTSKEHKNILRDIENIESELGQLISEPSSYINSQNKELPMLTLNKDNTLLLVSGYSAVLRQKIIKRLNELEEANKPKPMTLRESYLALAKAEEEKEILALALENKSIQLDESKEWLSIKRVASLNGLSWKELNWRELKAVGEAIGYLPRKIFDANYGMVNAYHMSVWKLIYSSLRLK